ncbi:MULTISPECIES: PTS fructose transporter subunit IIC [unclassified Haladaptatus]|uniref:PTS fructose transporter subunit IIC n=1 Tax=unclassified Haladaptatus TaxID=2622732 RepID=UPI0023E86176|nr:MULTISPECIES: PTS fructose transporter subunit IIC [unclassified Haladaptatus]
MSSSDSAETALRAHVTSVKENLMTGVSFMIPFVTIGGIFLALGFAVGDTRTVLDNTGSLGWFLAQIGSAGLTLMVPVLGAYIAYAIADRPALAPGFVLSYLLQQGTIVTEAGKFIGLDAGGLGAGYLGALVAGLLTGYVARFFKNLNVPRVLAPMMPVLIIPVLTTAVLAPVVLFGIGAPVAIANESLNTFLKSLQGGQAVVIGLILGGMMAFDMGGPVNKVAYLFSVGLISEQVYAPMAAVMIAGMTPPIGMAISNYISPERYASEMKENAKNGFLMGFSFITEGAIPYAAADPLRVIPALVAGSAVAGGASMSLGVTMPAPHGGMFVVFLSNQPLLFIGCVLLGSLVTAGVATGLKSAVGETVTGTTSQTSD